MQLLSKLRRTIARYRCQVNNNICSSSCERSALFAPSIAAKIALRSFTILRLSVCARLRKRNGSKRSEENGWYQERQEIWRGVNRVGEGSPAINRGRSTSDFKDSSWCVRTHRGFRLPLFMFLDPRSSGGPGMSSVPPKRNSTAPINYFWPVRA